LPIHTVAFGSSGTETVNINMLLHGRSGAIRTLENTILEEKNEEEKISSLDSTKTHKYSGSSIDTINARPSPPRVLVVDDSAINRKMLCRLLARHCLEISQAGDGLEAISCYKRGLAGGVQYDVILMDHLMPNMDGPTAARELRSLGYDKLIVGLTGVTDESRLAVFWSSGVNHILKKPLNIEELLRVIGFTKDAHNGREMNEDGLPLEIAGCSVSESERKI